MAMRRMWLAIVAAMFLASGASGYTMLGERGTQKIRYLSETTADSTYIVTYLLPNNPGDELWHKTADTRIWVFTVDFDGTVRGGLQTSGQSRVYAAADSTINTTGDGTPPLPKRFGLAVAVAGATADSSIDRSGSNTESSPKKLKVELASIVNADSSLKITGTPTVANPKRFKVNPAMMTRAQADSTLDTSGDATPASPKLLGVNLATNFAWTGTHTIDGAPVALVLSDTVSYLVPDDSVAVGTLPAGAIVTLAIAQIETAFNSGTGDALSVGSVADHNLIVNSTAIDETSATVQICRGSLIAGSPVAVATPIWIYYESTGGAPTTGAARLSVHFYVP